MTLEERNQYIEDNQNLVWSRVHKIAKRTSEELFQVGTLGFITALDRYDEQKPLTSSYLVSYIDGYIRMYMRGDNLIKPTKTRAGDKYAETCSLEKQYDLSSPDDFTASVAIGADINKFLNNLTPKRKEVIILLAQGYTATEIAKALGITGEAVRRRINQTRALAHRHAKLLKG